MVKSMEKMNTMSRYSVNTCGGENGFLEVDLDAIKPEDFPVQLSNSELWEKVVKAVGEERARDYCLRAWTNLNPGLEVVTEGGYSSEEGRFLGYAQGVLASSGGPACLWGDSDASDAEFSYVSGHCRDCVFAVCRTTSWRGVPIFWLAPVYDEGERELAKALGVKVDELFIAA